jgi:hypothetical protein
MTENNMSGLELRLVEGTVYVITQLLSYCNKVTSEYHKVIGNIFLNYINMIHLKDIYVSKMKSYQSIDMLNRGLMVNLKDEKTDQNPTGEILLGEPVPRPLRVEPRDYRFPDPFGGEVDNIYEDYTAEDDGPDMDNFF